MTISYSLSRKWDHEQLAGLANEINPAFFPFETKFKENQRTTRVFEGTFPDMVEKLETALTQTPRKPTVKLWDAKAEAA